MVVQRRWQQSSSPLILLPIFLRIIAWEDWDPATSGECLAFCHLHVFLYLKALAHCFWAQHAFLYSRM